MKLSMNILYMQLADYLPISDFHYNPSDRILENVALWEADGPVQPECVYITTLDHLHELLASDERVSAILVCDIASLTEAIDLEARRRCDLIYLPKAQTFQRVFNAIHSVFTRCMRWENEMMSALLGDASVKQILAQCGALTDNTLALFDDHFFLLASTEKAIPSIQWDQDDHGVRYLPLSIINQITLSENYRTRYRDGGRPFLLNDDTLDANMVFAPFCDTQGRRFTLVQFDSARPLQQGDCEWCEIFVEAVQKKLSSTYALHQGPTKDFETVLTSLIRDNIFSQKTLQPCLDHLGWKPTDLYVLVCIETSRWSSASPFITNLCIQLEKSIAHSFAVPIDANIALVVDLTRSGQTLPTVATRLAYFLREGLFKAGISNLYTLFDTSYYYYLQAVAALEMGSIYDRSKWYHYFEDHALEYITYHGTSVIPAKYLCSFRLITLFHYDLEHGTEIWRTLKAYLECSCNINHTAEKLFIHRNTLYARLAIIRSLIPLDDMDQNDLLYLRVSYFLCERIQQFEPLEDEARAIFG